MQIHSAEEAKKRFDSLPPEIKNILYSPEMAFVMQQVGQKQQLHIDQIDFLNTETGQVLLGFVDMKDFASELMENLNIDRMKADAIAQDVNDMLFVKIRESMKKVYEQNTQAPAPKAPQNPPTMEKSVVMPSSITSPAPATLPVALAPLSPTPPMPTKAPEMHPADVMLTQKTVQTAPVTLKPTPVPSTGAPQTQMPKPEPPKPGAYKADPYREPPE